MLSRQTDIQEGTFVSLDLLIVALHLVYNFGMSSQENQTSEPHSQ